MTSSSDPTVLWRLSRGRSTAHATIFPGDGQTTVTWFFDGVMDRAENYELVDLALARADQIRGDPAQGRLEENRRAGPVWTAGSGNRRRLSLTECPQ